MREERFVLIDVGCIECGVQTEVAGIFDSEDEAEKAFNVLADEKDIEKWEPRGGILELRGLPAGPVGQTSFVGGCGYFDGGQHALEIHVVPPRVHSKEEVQ